jgi:hypothetical protein
MHAYLGLERTGGWCERRVLRVAPCLFGLYTVVAALYAQLPAGRRLGGVIAWAGKQDVTFSDAVTAVRRWLWVEWFFSLIVPDLGAGPGGGRLAAGLACQGVPKAGPPCAPPVGKVPPQAQHNPSQKKDLRIHTPLATPAEIGKGGNPPRPRATPHPKIGRSVFFACRSGVWPSRNAVVRSSRSCWPACKICWTANQTTASIVLNGGHSP